MKKFIHPVPFLLMLFCGIGILSPSAQSSQHSKLDLKTFLSGTKVAYIELTKKEQDLVDSDKHPIIAAFAAYLESLNFEKVVYTSEAKTKLMLQVPTLCDVVKVRLDMVFSENKYKDGRIRFRSCLQDEYFRFYRPEIPNDANLYSNLNTAWRQMFGDKIIFEPANRLRFEERKSYISEERVKEMLTTMGETHDFIEGIYEKKPVYNYTNRQHKIAILKSKNRNTYDIFYLSGISNFLDWKQGELMGSVPMTNNEFQYNDVEWMTAHKMMEKNGSIRFSDNNNFNLTLEGHSFKYEYERVPIDFPPVVDFDPYATDNLPDDRSKEVDAVEDYRNPIAAEENNLSGNFYLSSTGSAVALDETGHIVTNYHVVAGHDYIELMIPNSRYKVAYRAVVVCSDEETDLAILKIADVNFRGLPKIPYYFRYREVDVGEEVFTLGFPMVESMGWDIKLGDGLISSRKGYKDDPKTYQISVPVNPGNSGGPLFSKDAQLVGIIKAKHSKADNASYALKTSNILSLINQSGLSITLPTSKYLSNKEMTDQVKYLEAFVFWVKAFKIE